VHRCGFAFLPRVQGTTRTRTLRLALRPRRPARGLHARTETGAPEHRGAWPSRAHWQAAVARLGAAYGIIGVRSLPSRARVHNGQPYAGVARAPHVAGATALVCAGFDSNLQ
jgi:hypothetical protein